MSAGARDSRKVWREKTILAKIRELRQKVGQGLSLFVLKKYAGGAEPELVDQADADHDPSKVDRLWKRH